MRTLEPISKPAQTVHKVNVTKIEVPANEFVNQPIIQPIYERENLKVQFMEGQDQIFNSEPISRDPIIQERLRERTIEKPGDLYYRQDVFRPYITKQHVQVQFNQPDPVFKQNEKIVLPSQEVQQHFTLQHQFAIPVDDQRLVATPSKVAYDIPVHHYQYIPIYSQSCVPCCGCLPEPSNEQLAVERIQRDRWNEVLRKFSQKYGRDTFDASALNNVGQQKEVIPYEQVALLLKKKELAKKLGEYDNNHYFPEELEDPSGWEYVDAPQNCVEGDKKCKGRWRKGRAERFDRSEWVPGNYGDDGYLYRK